MAPRNLSQKTFESHCNPLPCGGEKGGNVNKLELYFPFEPIPKGRPRFTRTGHAYTPKRTAGYERVISQFYKDNSGVMFEGPISIKLIFQMPIPKSFSKKKVAQILEGQIKHIKKPDCDNLAKSFLDALNGIAFEDDSRITKLTLVKRYSAYPGTTLYIEEDVE